MIDFPLLSAICKAPGAPGFEQAIRNLVINELEGIADEVYLDSMGSIVAIKKGSEAKKSNGRRPHG